jgi:sensor histidine kinase YesM
MQNQKIKNEKLQAELSHLKLQIHPHFLFNTLNSIYASAIKKDDKTADTVLIFSDFMRYFYRIPIKMKFCWKKKSNTSAIISSYRNPD